MVCAGPSTATGCVELTDAVAPSFDCSRCRMRVIGQLLKGALVFEGAHVVGARKPGYRGAALMAPCACRVPVARLRDPSEGLRSRGDVYQLNGIDGGKHLRPERRR